MFLIDLYEKSGNIHYLGKHAGLLYIQAIWSNLSDVIQINDLYYYNNGSSVGSLEVGSGVSCTSDGDCICITTSTTGEKYVRVPVSLTGDWVFECELAKIGEVNVLTFDLTSPHFWGAFGGTDCLVNLADSTQNIPVGINIGDILKCSYINGTFNVYINDTLIRGKSTSINNAKIGWYTNQNRKQYIKDIKVNLL